MTDTDTVMSDTVKTDTVEFKCKLCKKDFKKEPLLKKHMDAKSLCNKDVNCKELLLDYRTICDLNTTSREVIIDMKLKLDRLELELKGYKDGSPKLDGEDKTNDEINILKKENERLKKGLKIYKGYKEKYTKLESESKNASGEVNIAMKNGNDLLKKQLKEYKVKCSKLQGENEVLSEQMKTVIRNERNGTTTNNNYNNYIIINVFDTTVDYRKYIDPILANSNESGSYLINDNPNLDENYIPYMSDLDDDMREEVAKQIKLQEERIAAEAAAEEAA
jgi:hypothetical protein